MPRAKDNISIETDAGAFDKFQRLSISNDIFGLTEATFELGDASSWAELSSVLAPGEAVRVSLNGKPRLTGRAEVNTVPISPSGGTVIQLTVRTKMADARYRSAPPKTKVESTSIKDFVLACYAAIGVGEDDFSFAPFTSRDLMTGVGGPKGDKVDLEPIKPDQAKVQPPETVHEAVERHLRRYQATHWDDPDGKILVGKPDDEQAPLYKMQAKRGNKSQGNNLLRAQYIRDWSEVALTVQVVGTKRGVDAGAKGIRGLATDDDVADALSRTGHFNRLVLLQAQQIESQQQADQMATRELSARRRRKDAWELTTDGWTFWDGSSQIPYAHNTTVDVDVDTVQAVARGRYLVTKVKLDLDLSAGATTTMTCIAPGLFVL
jgi:prophage tail gpP-like protein